MPRGFGAHLVVEDLFERTSICGAFSPRSARKEHYVVINNTPYPLFRGGCPVSVQTTRSPSRIVYLDHLGFAMMSAPLVVRHTGVTRCGPCSADVGDVQVGAYVLFRLDAYCELVCVSIGARRGIRRLYMPESLPDLAR